MKKADSIEKGIWLHPQAPGPLIHFPYISQFGDMKFSKVRMDENMKPHLNDGIEIHYVESGRYEWTINGNPVFLYPGDLSITAPWQLNGSPAGKMDMGHISWIILKPENYSQKVSLDFGPLFKSSKAIQGNLGELIAIENGIVIRNVKVLSRYFKRISEELRTQGAGYKIVIRNLLENFLIALNRQLSTRQQKIAQEGFLISQLSNEICKDFSKKWPVEDLAMKFGMGKTKFTAMVKKLTGYPPNSFIIHLRIAYAKEVLKKERNVNLTNLAYECGFSSLQHFTTYFSNRTGLSPANFHKQIHAIVLKDVKK
ncbi:AraC family transcriptional regulator [Belliella sp. DSM 111904]|uniref:AraC family transcriptional regulator n=1 Tax=Belliella filtrata TaxID=2923435 RepID=A0ABS9UVY8_9BACT|nr:AraC family transcriptional regulator [Belliella filtrata]MCH7408120.1 AraC family transcriptional regulator [Belliella filtrata]